MARAQRTGTAAPQEAGTDMRDDELQQIGEYVKRHLGEWLVEAGLGTPAPAMEHDLRERMVRVEEALLHQRELMQQGFALIE